MRIYIAAPFQLRDEAIVIMHRLESLRHVVTSRWLRMVMDDNAGSARMDLDDVAASDLVLLLNGPSGGGKDVEMGYALALGLPIVLLGRRTNVFHHLPQVRVIERIEDL